MWETLKIKFIQFMEWDQALQQFANFKQGLHLVFYTIVVGFLAWYLANTFGKKEICGLIKLIIVCECVRILSTI